MKWPVISTLIAKDLKLYYRDKFFGIMTIVSFIMIVGFYFIMPRSVNETIEIGIYGGLARGLIQQQIEAEGGAEGVILHSYEAETDLKKAVMDEQVQIGISIPDTFFTLLMAGRKPAVVVYLSSELPPELREMYEIFMGEMVGTLGSAGINMESEEIMLGPDMGGKQIPFRDRMLPFFVFMVLILETFGLATLITIELEKGTAQALLTTPMSVVDLFTGKGLAGVIIAFTQAALLMMITGSLAQQTLLILLTLLLSAGMVTGLAFIIASIAKDMMTAAGWGTLAMMIFSIPAVIIFLGGAASGWIKVIPSFYVVDTLHRAMNFNIGWAGNYKNLLWLTGFNGLFVTVGIVTMKRKLA